MTLAVYTPSAPLSAFVANLWALNDARSGRERIVPSGTLELVVNLAEDAFSIYDAPPRTRCRRYSGALVSGAYDRPFIVDAAAHASIIGVHFRAGGAHPFLGLPPGELASTHIDLEILWGSGARELRDRLRLAPTPARRFRILEGALMARLAGRPSRHVTLDAALSRLSSGASVRALVAELGVSHRHFIEVFHAQVGMTPKVFSRVQRFQRASARARRHGSPDWAAVAAECGYCDQSHLIHDFNAFAGVSPVDFLRDSQPHLKDNHLTFP